MIDFSKLLNETPEDRDERRQHLEGEREKAEIAADIGRRESWSRQTIAATVVEEPEIRMMPSYEQIVHLRCEAPDGRQFAARYWLPAYYTNAAETVLRIAAPGKRLNLKGYWKTRQWNDARGAQRSTREFNAQFILDPAG